MLAETTETFADQFDLSLLVGENNDGKFQAQYNVVLASLCLASPVFKAMHLGPFKEKDERIIRLPEDDPDGLSTLLRIMHFQFKALPKFTIDRIAKIAIMSDKYQCIEILHPWMDEIQETISASALDWAKVEDSLFAAWIFKEHDSFKKALRCIILDSKTNYRLDLMINERKVDEALLPEGMKKHILSERQTLLEKLIGICRTTKHKLLTQDNCKSVDRKYQENCNAVLAGSFARRTTAIFGGEILFCANDRFTVNGLLDQIKASSTESVAHFRHESCWKQAHPTEIESVRSSVSSALTFGEGRFKTEKSIKEEKDFAVAAQAGQTSGGFGSGGIGRHGGPSGSGGSDSWASLFGRSVS